MVANCLNLNTLQEWSLDAVSSVIAAKNSLYCLDG